MGKLGVCGGHINQDSEAAVSDPRVQRCPGQTTSVKEESQTRLSYD